MQRLNILIITLLLSLSFACKKKPPANNKIIYTKLHMAVRERDSERLKQLILSGEDVNVKNKYGDPPIAFAISEGSLTMTKILVEGGADLGLKKRIENSLLHISADSNRTNIAKYLIQQGLSVTAVNKEGSTPLHLAAKNGNLELIETFLKLGADPKAMNRYQETPLHLAVHSRKPNALTLIINAGANVNAPDHRENTPLHLAATRDKEVIEVLLKNNAQINLRNKMGMTPLAIANYMERNHIPENWEDCNSTLFRKHGGIVENKPVYVWKANSRIPMIGSAVYKFNIEKNHYTKIGLTNEEGMVPYTELYGQSLFEFCLIYDGKNTSPTLEVDHPEIDEHIHAKPFNVNHWPAIRLEAKLSHDKQIIE